MATVEVVEPQHMVSLRLANQVRSERTRIHQALKAQEVTVGELLEDPPACLAKLTIGELLTWQRQWGTHRAHAFLRDLEPPDGLLRPVGGGVWIAETRIISALTGRMRTALIDGLREEWD